MLSSCQGLQHLPAVRGAAALVAPGMFVPKGWGPGQEKSQERWLTGSLIAIVVHFAGSCAVEKTTWRKTSSSCFDPNSHQEYFRRILPHIPLAACSVLRQLFSSHRRARALIPTSLHPQNRPYFGNKVNPAERLHFVKFSGSL